VYQLLESIFESSCTSSLSQSLQRIAAFSPLIGIIEISKLAQFSQKIINKISLLLLLTLTDNGYIINLKITDDG
jgi:hypothetical protein